MNQKVNDMERMIRELKESNKRMMKIISEQFTQLAMSNREKGVFPIQFEVNSKGGSSTSCDPNDIWKMNVVISLRFGTMWVSKMRMILLPCDLLSIPLKVMMCFPPKSSKSHLRI